MPARHFTRTLAGGFAVAFGNLPSELRSAAHLRVSAMQRDTKASRKNTKMQHCSLPRQSAKRKVDIICGMEDKLLYRDEVQARVADQFRLLSSRDHRAVRALIRWRMHFDASREVSNLVVFSCHFV